MKESNVLFLTLLFELCVFTNAAPPLNSQSSTVLSLINTTASFPALQNITFPHTGSRVSVGPPFTPGREPSEEVIFYDVPFSDPPVNIKFKDYEFNNDRNETDVDECFRKAMRECSDRAKHFTVMTEDESKSWESGDVFLDLLPRKGDPDQEQALTYGIFTDALQGLNNFRLFYPHLNFWYEIYVYPGEEMLENYVGVGQLGIG
ncbi:MAG: hypothetical protein Q9161_008338 [Pseudevernia consocians]